MEEGSPCERRRETLPKSWSSHAALCTPTLDSMNVGNAKSISENKTTSVLQHCGHFPHLLPVAHWSPLGPRFRTGTLPPQMAPSSAGVTQFRVTATVLDWSFKLFSISQGDFQAINWSGYIFLTMDVYQVTGGKVQTLKRARRCPGNPRHWQAVGMADSSAVVHSSLPLSRWAWVWGAAAHACWNTAATKDSSLIYWKQEESQGILILCVYRKTVKMSCLLVDSHV